MNVAATHPASERELLLLNFYASERARARIYKFSVERTSELHTRALQNFALWRKIKKFRLKNFKKVAREPWVSVSDPAARSLTKIIIRRRQLTLTQGPQKFECPAHAHFFTSRARRGNEKKTYPRHNSRHFKVQNSDCEPEFTRKCGSSGRTEEFCKSYLIRFLRDFFQKSGRKSGSGPNVQWKM